MGLTRPNNLGAPGALPDGALRVIPLGGLGAIGRNMTLFEYEGRLLIVDCGVLFPDVDQPGVDLILPDFTPILDRLDDIEAIVVTHGHEDHIGAIPYLLEHKNDIPVVGSRFSVALVEAKLRERRIKPAGIVVAENETLQLGPFGCEFLAVNHSIPDALAVAIRTEAGLVLHTGDFKMDQLPLDGRITDLAGFARLGDQGVDLLLSDSTNAEIPGFVTSERQIGPVLDKLFEDVKGRIIVASFASHVHRVQQVLDAAYAHGRKVAFVGRSMVRNMAIARDLGLMHVPDGLLVSMDEAVRLPADEIVYMSTGSQGEPMSALGRMASGDHRHIAVEPEDTIILASSLVPGNETAVYGVINRLARTGATVIHKDVAKVHVSGHAPAGELLYVLNVVKPSNMIPVHGEARHLQAHARLAIESGVPADQVIVIENGDVVDLIDGVARTVGPRPEQSDLCGRPLRGRRRRAGPQRAPRPRRRRLHRRHGRDRLRERQGRRRPHRLGARLLGGPQGLRRRAPAHQRRDRTRRGGRHHRPAPAAADPAAHGRQVGQRHLPPPPDDRAARP